MQRQSFFTANLALAVSITLCLAPRALAQDTAAAVTSPAPATETVCDNHLDDDADGLADCADADCFDAPSCQAGGRLEGDERTCGDWIDNDGDGYVDCDDADCQSDNIRACRGSVRTSTGTTFGASQYDDLPELTPGQTLEDLIGTHGDEDGE